MNGEQIKTKAAEAIEAYRNHHGGTCFLSISNGEVVALDLRHAPVSLDACLSISPYDQTRGLTPAEWNRVGTALLNLYRRENR